MAGVSGWGVVTPKNEALVICIYIDTFVPPQFSFFFFDFTFSMSDHKKENIKIQSK